MSSDKLIMKHYSEDLNESIGEFLDSMKVETVKLAELGMLDIEPDEVLGFFDRMKEEHITK